jgi:phosphoesterase RecJ-like protein
MYNASGLPHQFDWLPLPAPVHTCLCGTEAIWIIVLDCGAASRVGPELHQIMPSRPVANIDHHLGNPCFGQHNWVDDSYPPGGDDRRPGRRTAAFPLTGRSEAIYLATPRHRFLPSTHDPRSGARRTAHPPGA